MIMRQLLCTSTLAVGQEQFTGLLAGSPRVVLVAATSDGVKLTQIAVPGTRARRQAILVNHEKLAFGTGSTRVASVALAVTRPEELVDTEAGLRVAAYAPAFFRAATEAEKFCL